MQKLLLFVISVFLLISCKKNGPVVTPGQDDKKTKFSYTVEGITPIVLRHGLDKTTLQVSIKSNANEQQPASIYLENIPGDIKATINGPNGVLPFTPQITLSGIFAKAGVYNYTIVTKVGQETPIKHQAKLTVNETSSIYCSESFYNAIDETPGPGQAYKEINGIKLHYDRLTGVISTGNMVVERPSEEDEYFYTAPKPEIIITVDCNTRTINIPPVIITAVLNGMPDQTMTYNVWGNGSINLQDNSFTIDMHIDRTDGTLNQLRVLKSKLNF